MKKLRILIAILFLLFISGTVFAIVENLEIPPKQYTGNGVTTDFPITFDYDSDSDLTVSFVNDSDGSIDDWTQDALGDQGYTIVDDEVIANTAPDDGRLVIDGETPLTQTLNLKNNRATPAELYEAALDKGILATRDVKAILDRTMTAPATADPDVDYTAPEYEAGSYWQWHPTIKELRNAEIASSAVVGTEIGDIVKLIDDGSGIGVFPQGTVQNPIVYNTGVDYNIFSKVLGSDSIEYQCAIANGPSSSVVDPVGDLTGTWISLSARLSLFGCDLPTALAALGSVDPVQLTVDCECIIAEGTTETITDNIATNIIKGGSIDGVAGGSTETLVINGPFEAGKYKVFGDNITVTGLTDFRVEHFGTDVLALGRAEAAISSNGGTFRLGTDIAISAMVAFDVENTVVVAEGVPKITYTGTGTAIRLGADHITWPDIEILNSDQNWDDGTDTTSVGLEIYDAKYCDVIAYVEGFFEGCKVNGFSIGASHNKIKVNRLYDNRRNFSISRTTGFSNSNLIVGGNFTYRGGTTINYIANMLTVHDVYQDNPDDNHNVFVGSAFQGGNSQYTQLIYMNGQYNDFVSCRYEIASYDGTYTAITFDTNSLYNKIKGGRWLATSYTIAECVTDNGSRNSFETGTEMDYGNLIRLIANSGKFNGTYDSNAIWDGVAQVEAQNTNSSAKYNFKGLKTDGTVSYSVTGNGQVGINTPDTEMDSGAANAAMEQLKGFGFTGTWAGSSWKRTHDVLKTTTATGATMWRATIAEGTVMQVVVHLLGRKTDNTKYVQIVMRGIYDTTSGVTTLGASELTDPVALNVGGFDVTDCVLTKSGADAILAVGGNEAADYYFSAKIEWQSVSTDS